MCSPVLASKKHDNAYKCIKACESFAGSNGRLAIQNYGPIYFFSVQGLESSNVVGNMNNAKFREGEDHFAIIFGILHWTRLLLKTNWLCLLLKMVTSVDFQIYTVFQKVFRQHKRLMCDFHLADFYVVCRVWTFRILLFDLNRHQTNPIISLLPANRCNSSGSLYFSDFSS